VEHGARVAVVFSLGDAGLLEVELVPYGVVGLRHDCGRPRRSTRPERYAEADDAAKPVRAQLRGVPGYNCAPIVAGDHGPVDAQSVKQPNHVAEDVEQGVLVDRLGPVGLAVAAHVGRHGVEPGLGEGGELMAPGVPELGKAVAEYDERTDAGFGEMHADAVGRDGAVRHFGRHDCHPM
jgi:hypothetical protein